MIPLSYYTSLWQKMLFDCLSSVCSMLLSKGQLNSYVGYLGYPF